MRAFWEQEEDALVWQVLSEMLDDYEASCDLGDRERDTASLTKAREIVARLSGRSPEVISMTREAFLNEEFNIPSILSLPVKSVVSEIIQKPFCVRLRCVYLQERIYQLFFQCGEHSGSGFSLVQLKGIRRNSTVHWPALNRTAK